MHEYMYRFIIECARTKTKQIKGTNSFFMHAHVDSYIIHSRLSTLST